MSQLRQVITQGEQAVSDDPNLVVTTLLGSCVSCCLWDPVSEVGGINHMLTTRLSDPNGIGNLTGVNAMELLINGILKQGGKRSRLIAKVFGGARMVRGLSDIGASNAEFTMDYLKNEGIHCLSHSIGGDQARQLMFWPATGIARQKFVPNVEQEQDLQIAPKPAEQAGHDLELF